MERFKEFLESQGWEKVKIKNGTLKAKHGKGLIECDLPDNCSDEEFYELLTQLYYGVERMGRDSEPLKKTINAFLAPYRDRKDIHGEQIFTGDVIKTDKGLYFVLHMPGEGSYGRLCFLIYPINEDGTFNDAYDMPDREELGNYDFEIIKDINKDQLIEYYSYAKKATEDMLRIFAEMNKEDEIYAYTAREDVKCYTEILTRLRA